MKLNKPANSLVDPVSRKWTSRRDFLKQLGEDLGEEAIRRIEKTKSSPEGQKWKPWASSTAKARRKEGSAGLGLLLRTGTLRDSIGYQVQGDKVIVMTNVPYARYLQHGTSKMPARPFLGTGPREEKVMKSLWKKWINQ